MFVPKSGANAFGTTKERLKIRYGKNRSFLRSSSGCLALTLEHKWLEDSALKIRRQKKNPKPGAVLRCTHVTTHCFPPAHPCPPARVGFWWCEPAPRQLSEHHRSSAQCWASAGSQPGMWQCQGKVCLLTLRIIWETKAVLACEPGGEGSRTSRFCSHPQHLPNKPLTHPCALHLASAAAAETGKGFTPEMSPVHAITQSTTPLSLPQGRAISIQTQLLKHLP